MARTKIRVLTAPERAVVTTFRNLKLAHPKLNIVDQETRLMIDQPGDSAAILVQGPTGVGKSTLADAIGRSLADDQLAELAADSQLYPPLVIRAPAPSGSQFSWHDFLHRALVELGEPAVDRKGGLRRDPKSVTKAANFRTIDGIRLAFEDAVGARKPKAIIVDEAQHLTNVGSGVRLSHQLDFIKSLSDATESVFVLIGTYDLTDMRNQSGQLGRRCLDVHFARYHWTMSEEQEQFAAVVSSFAASLPVDPEVLLGRLPYIYERTAGCVGILKPWLVRSLVAAMRAEREMTIADLEGTALPAKTLDVIVDEIALGEAAIEDDADTVSGLRRKLGLTPLAEAAPDAPVVPLTATPIADARQSPAGATIPTRRQTQRVGRRGAHRDKVGSPS
jgi:hypothetical protein